MIKNTLSHSSNLYDAVKAIESSYKRLAVVLSDNNNVIGTLTDGDIRRYLLAGGSLNDSAIKAMNSQPIVVNVNTLDNELKKILKKNNIRSVPLIDQKNKFIRTLHENDLFNENIKIFEKNFAAAVIMAGGEGKRLRPITKKIPKPMVDINGISLLERQIRKLKKTGITDIFISVNYLGNIIKEYFQDGSKFEVNITYLEESKKLGTAGALSYLPHFSNNQSILVLNGDILTSSDFLNLFHFHNDQCSAITLCTINYFINIPFGVVEQESTKLKSIIEKPSKRYLCNAGIYALSGKVLQRIPNDRIYNMTDLINECLIDKVEISIFPVHEFWSDIGTPDDLKEVRRKFLSKI